MTPETLLDFRSMRDSLDQLDSETWKAIRKAAKGNDAEAQFLLGCRFLYGKYSVRGCKKWLESAAAQDHAGAMRVLAQTEFKPELRVGTCPRTVEGRYLLERAAELGSIDAQRDLAVCFVWGEGPFEQDWAKVRFWYLKAAELGHQEAKIAVGSMMIKGDGGPVELARGLAFIEEAAKGPDLYEATSAAMHLGHLYSGTCNVPIDEAKAAEWAARAEELEGAKNSDES